jgi:hypothetical protein
MKRSKKSPSSGSRGVPVPGQVHPECREDFMLLAGPDKKAFLETFGSLRLSMQAQREFLEWLPEIAAAENKGVAAVLDSREVSRVLKDRRMNNPQKIRHLRGLFHARRFPRFHETLRRWEALARSVNPDRRRVRFDPAPSFEKDVCTVRVEVSDPGSAIELFGALSRIDVDSWKALIGPGGKFPP